MREEIERLIKVQEEDIKIYSLKKERAAIPLELDSAKDKLKNMEDRAKAKEEGLKKLQADRKEMEIDLATAQEDIKKYDTQLFQIKTNIEYKAMQKKITDRKFECGIIEDKILEKMEDIERVQREKEEVKKDVEKAKEMLKQKEAEIKERDLSINLKLEELERERNVLLQGISPGLIERYEMIFRNKRDKALVPVNNNTCQGCHMKLPPNVVNEARKAVRLVICDNCARMLYYNGE